MTMGSIQEFFVHPITIICVKLEKHREALERGDKVLYGFEDKSKRYPPESRDPFAFDPEVARTSTPVEEATGEAAGRSFLLPRHLKVQRLNMNVMAGRRACGHLRTRSDSNPFEYDPWACLETIALYQDTWPRKSIRSCFFEVHPYMDRNISLIHEFNDPTGQPLLPPVVLNEPSTNVIAGTVNDSVLEGENQRARIEEINGYTIAVEASWYLQNRIDAQPMNEPLLAALGGLPYSMDTEIEDDLDQWKKAGLTPVFVFDGLSIIGQEEMSLRAAKEAAVHSEEAWALYDAAKTPEATKDAVTVFGTAGAIQPKSLYGLLQEILFKRGLRYEIASHSACAHMAYFDKHPIRIDRTQSFEAIMGSAELLLYDIHYSVITKIDFSAGVFHAITKHTLPSKLNVSEDTLANALLMIGTSILPTFPVLKDREIIKQQPYTITDAINMYRTANKSMITLCDTWTEILQKQEPNWSDKYRKAKMAIKHNIHLVDGDPTKNRAGACVVVSNYDNLTGDHHEYIGLQLPEELYHYLVHGNIGRRVMNWLTHLEMLVKPPLDGGNAAEYRRLVTQDLIPIQSQSIALYTVRMHRAFQHKDFTIRFWFDNTTTVVVKYGTAQPTPDRLAATWRVNQSSFEPRAIPTSGRPGSFSFALMTLQDADFAKSTIAKGAEIQGLKSQTEILSNTIWRLLHLRGYVNDAHQPTVWGEALVATFSDLAAKKLSQLEEAAFLAFELLRLDQLNVRVRHDEWIGAPQQGSDSDKDHCLLIARCACLLKLRHKLKGYTGPLSKNLLAFHSIIKSVREADRDLIEAIVASMFMFAHADRRFARDNDSTQTRKRNNRDWIKLGLSLPFGKDVDVGLGIAVRTYLDDYVGTKFTRSKIEKIKAEYVSEQLPDSLDFSGDLEIAFGFFNSLCSGVKVLGSLVPAEDAAIWEGAAKYLSARRIGRDSHPASPGTA